LGKISYAFECGGGGEDDGKWWRSIVHVKLFPPQ
jgi:hypothetical protein